MKNLVWLALLGSGPTAAQDSGESLAVPALPGFAIGHEHAALGSLVREWVPAGENVRVWTRMVTQQRFAGVIADGLTLERWAGAFSTNLRSGCAKGLRWPP